MMMVTVVAAVMVLHFFLVSCDSDGDDGVGLAFVIYLSITP